MNRDRESPQAEHRDYMINRSSRRSFCPVYCYIHQGVMKFLAHTNLRVNNTYMNDKCKYKTAKWCKIVVQKTNSAK